MIFGDIIIQRSKFYQNFWGSLIFNDAASSDAYADATVASA